MLFFSNSDVSQTDSQKQLGVVLDSMVMFCMIKFLIVPFTISWNQFSTMHV